MQLFHAARQWAERPADERFQSLEALHRATLAYALVAGEANTDWATVRVEAQGPELALVGRVGVPARLTHHAFGQLASRAGAPSSYLRRLPPTLAAQNLNHGFKTKGDAGAATEAQLLFHTNGGLLLRAATSTRYNRIWNHEVVECLGHLAAAEGLVPARQTMTWHEGETIPEDAPRALYASDHDMFAFVMSEDKVIMDPVGQPLRRGVIVQNSEVGDKSLAFMAFYFREVCANHIIWDAEQLAEVRFSHVGDVHGKLVDALRAVRRHLNASAGLDAGALAEAGRRHLGDDRDEVVGRVFGKRTLGLARKTVEAAFDAVVPDEDGDPRTVWGLVQGLTRVSQETPYAEERVAADRVAGRLLQVAF